MKLLITPRFFETEIDELISVERKYFPFFKKFNHNIHMIPIMGMDLEEYFEEMNPDGVVFGGGYRLYTDEIRDFELRVLKLSLSKGIPILAICCGMWTVNYYYGGTLKFDESHQAFDGEKIILSKRTHPVVATNLVKQKTYKVNSFHSKIIDTIGSGLTPFLFAENDVVEGVYNMDRKILGIQFHMENSGVSRGLTKQVMTLFEKL
jgi:gamma-glutamyl-gamma-aminobutyrate hydrolase PuuD